MAEDINDYKFDFEREIPRLQGELGPWAEKILFIDITKPKEAGPFRSFLRRLIPGRKKNTFRGKQITDEQITIAHALAKIEYKEGNRGSASVPLQLKSDDDPRNKAVFLNNDDPTKHTFGKEYEDLLTLYALYHETGHCLIQEHARPNGPHIDNESAADAYATLCFLKRFGSAAVPFLSMWSWNRANFALVMGETGHYSTFVIDKIIDDRTDRDLSILTTAKTIALAKEYTERWTPNEAALSEARKFFNQDNTAIKIKKLLASTCLTSSSHDLAFLTGAKVVQPLLRPEGMVYAGIPIVFTAEERQRYISAINSRLATMRLQDLFNTAASATRPSVLPVALPPGQKQFIFNP